MNWRTLDNLLSSKLVASTFFWLAAIPILARVTERLPDILSFELNAVLIELPLILPFSWLVLYSAALFFGAARIIYLAVCPDHIRKFDNPQNAIDAGYTIQRLQEICELFFKPIRSKELDLKNNEALSRLTIQWSALNVVPDYSNGETDDINDGFKPIFKSLEDKASGTELAQIIRSATFVSPRNNRDFYVCLSLYELTLIEIEKHQLFKTLFWDFDRYLIATHPKCRFVATFLTACGGAAFLFVFVESLISVLNYLR
jgi:hypothetical protein